MSWETVGAVALAGAGLAVFLLAPVELVVEVAVCGARARWRVAMTVAGLSVLRRQGGVAVEEAAVLAASLAPRQAWHERAGGGLAGRWVAALLGREAGRGARVAGRVARRGRLMAGEVAGELGTADAAVTALLVGAVKATAAALPGVGELVRPAFGRAALDVRMRCIWRVRAGDVILAGLGF